MSKVMPRKRAGVLGVQKVKKPALVAREPQTSWINSVNTMLDTFRLIPWDPFRGFEWPAEYELPTRIPYVDVIDSGTEYVAKAELPGLKKETLAIEVGPNELSVAADSDVEREEKGKTYLHRERAFSTFRRNIGFPESIDTDRVSAELAEGILEIRLPKLVPRRQKKTRRLTLPVEPATARS